MTAHNDSHNGKHFDRSAFLPPAHALSVIETEILPLTLREVAKGNKVFGAAIIRKSDLKTIIAATNQETQNPLWHGEMQAIKMLYELPEDQRPNPKDCYFLATHEPCSLCLSAISWGGYDNFSYLFSYEQSRDDFAIPHDLAILKEVFGLGQGEYRHQNHYWQSAAIKDQIASLPADQQDALNQQIQRIAAGYDKASAIYQAHKPTSIPLN